MASTGPPGTIEQQLREMNEALLVSSVRQHELAEQAQKAEALQLDAREVRAAQHAHEVPAELAPAVDELATAREAPTS